MKTAVSIPDHLLLAAEQCAQNLGVSRSRLYAEAVFQFLEKNSGTETTRQLDAAYSTQPSSLDTGAAVLQFSSLEKEEW